MTDRPLIRQAELLIGPLSEDAGGGPTSQALRIFSDGSRTGLRVSFSVKKTLISAPNASEIKVYNLAPNSRERIRASLARVRLNVGWQNVGISTLTNGGLLSAVTEKQGPDFITSFQALDGYGGQVKGVANDTFEGAQGVSEVVRTLAAKMPGVQIGRIDIDGRLGGRGRVFSGRASEELDKMARQYGFSWSVQNGVFQAIQDNRSFNRVHLISYRDRNLVKASPVLNGPMQQLTGVEITAILDPRVSPGDTVQLESQNNAQLNGRYKVHEIDYDGDTYDQTWLMVIRSFKTI